MGHPRTTPKVLAALVARKSRDVGIDELMIATGLDDAQVRNAVRNLIEREGHPLTVIQRGAMWRLDDTAARPGAAPATDEMFEVVGRTTSGEVIAKGDQTDTLYRVTPL